MAFTIEELKPHIDKINSAWNAQQFQPVLTVAVDYLTGITSAVPTIVAGYENSLLAEFILLLKTPDKWDHKDQLILNLITQASVWQYVSNTFTYSYIRKVDETGHQPAWDALISFLNNRFASTDVFQLLLTISHGLYNPVKRTFIASLKTNYLKEYLKTADKNTFATIIRNNSDSHFNTDFLGCLIIAVPDAVDEFLEANLPLKGMINQIAVAPALLYNKGKFIPFILGNIKENIARKQIDEITNRFTVLLMVNEKQPGVADELLVQTADDYMNLYVSLDNKGWEYGFGSVTQHYCRFSALAADILLKNNAETGRERFWNIIQQTKYLHTDTLTIITKRLGEDAIPFLLKALEAEASINGIQHHKQVIELLKNFDKEKYGDRLWNFFQHKSKQVRQLMTQVLSTDINALEKSTALLNHKNADTRQSAAQVLSLLSSPQAKTVLQNAIANEKNDDARDVMLTAVFEDVYNTVNEDSLNQMIDAARNRGKLNKPVEEWLSEETLPPLYFNTGKKVSADAIRFLLYRMSRVKTMRSDVEARLIINQLNKEKSGDFALHIIKLFIDKGTKPEYKYLLALAALLGNDAVVDKIRITINHWIDDNRLKMAEYGVGALALQGSDKALRWVEWYSRKYRAKKANVGAAAVSALEAAAEELNITPYELGDRIVPDFGFEGLFKHFTVDGESYRAFIDSNFKMAFFNDDNKKLKALPAAADSAPKEEFKSIAKEVRDVVKSQSLRLEHYLMVQRKWTVEQWQQFFLNNPVMFIYATKLLWGIYDGANKLTQCFLCQEDTTLINEQNDEISLPENALIGIVHPLHIDTGLLQTWKQQFFDLSIEPVFPQLERPVYTLPEENKQLFFIHEFEDVKTQPGSIKSTLEKHGWRKGTAVDNGMIEVFFKDDFAGGIKAALDVQGVFAAGFDTDMDPALGKLYFINAAKEKNSWFSAPENDKDERLIPLGNLPEVFYSEVMAGVRAIKLLNTNAAE